MPAFLSKPANVLTVTLVFVVLGILTYVGATTMVRPKHAAIEVPAAQLRQALALAGLSAKPLAAAGLQQAQVTTVVGNTRSYLVEGGAGFSAALASFRDASLLVQKLERRVTSGQNSAVSLSALASARTALLSAAAAKESAINSVFTAGTAGLSSPTIQALTNFRANHKRPAPIEFQVANRSEENWMALRDALANDRISSRLGETPDPACRQLVLEARADTAVSAAQTSLGNLSALKTAWNQAVGQ